MSQATIRRRFIPAMEFAMPIPPAGIVETWRTEKWLGRLKAGDLVRVRTVHQPQCSASYVALVVRIDRKRPPAAERRRLTEVYGDVPLIRIVLDLGKDCPDPSKLAAWRI